MLGMGKTTKNTDFIADLGTHLGGLGLPFSGFSVTIFPMLSGVVPKVFFHRVLSLFGIHFGHLFLPFEGLWN